MNRRVEVLAALLNDDLAPADSSDSTAETSKREHDFIVFPYGGQTIIEEHIPQIAAIADFLKQHPDSIVTLDGQTDMVGSDSYNQKLSRARAEVVRNALIDSYGSNPDQIFITWTSENRAKDFITTEETEVASRRTEIRFSRIVDNLSSIKVKETSAQ